jgi:hypothetical protein
MLVKWVNIVVWKCLYSGLQLTLECRIPNFGPHQKWCLVEYLGAIFRRASARDGWVVAGLASSSPRSTV